MVSRTLAAILCICIIGLPLAPGQVALCSDVVSGHLDKAKHPECRCMTDNCTGGKCCCRDFSPNFSLGRCGCAETGHMAALPTSQSLTYQQNPFRVPFPIEIVDSAFSLVSFRVVNPSFLETYGVIGILLQTCSMRS